MEQVWQLQIAVDTMLSVVFILATKDANSHNYVLNTHVLKKVDVVCDLGVQVFAG